MSAQFNVRMERKTLTLIKKIASKRGEGTSDFVRRAINKELASLGFLPKIDMKALGVKK